MAEVNKAGSILDVGGLDIGQAEDAHAKTGVTVILPRAPAPCAVDVRGGGPGTRETDALRPSSLVGSVHGLVLAGGSVYGLAAADGAANWLGAQRRGYAPAPAPVPVSPIVPAAILFDNANGGDKDWGMRPPFYELGLKACRSAGEDLRQGRAGAGYGALAGIYPGGIGSASEQVGDMMVGAIMAVNPVGSPYMPGTDCFYAWPYEIGGEFGGVRPPQDFRWHAPTDTKLAFLKSAGQATIIGAVATNAKLDTGQLQRLAIMAQDGISMAVQPAHSPLDGDTVFALSTGDKSCAAPVALAELGAAAARCTARSIAKAVYEARA